MGLDITVYKVKSAENVPSSELDDNYHSMKGQPELDIFKHLAFPRVIQYDDIETAAKQQGYDYKDLQWRSTTWNEQQKIVYAFVTVDNVRVELIEPPTIEETEMCLYLEEVGYQRKGANKQFYEDGMWDSPCVVDKETLLKHWELYFSNKTPESKGGWGSGVEFDLTDDEMRSRFKENIIDKFIEGETIVMYH